MSLEVIETGEVVEPLSRVEAERLTARIADKLDSIADNLEQVLPLIGEALTRDAWNTLGYSSPTAYVSDRFTGALTRLPREIRQPVVHELSAAGMSTRAIAPIVGVSAVQVHQDVTATANPVSSSKPRTSHGMDGKTRTHQPAPEPVKPPEPEQPKRRPLPDQFFTVIYDLRKNIERLAKLTEDDRYPQNKEKIALTHESDLIRATEDLLAAIQTMNNK